MVDRLINTSTKQSFFLFGARGTGKTSLIRERFSENSHYIDLLNLDTEARLQLRPESLVGELAALPKNITTVIIDEVQKIPRLLDVVQRAIEGREISLSREFRFILTGSSARKLRAGSANLLAGRAVVFHLHPLLAVEMSQKFILLDALTYGTLPKAVFLDDSKEKKRFLTAYANTYLKEEVWGEQLIRKIEPFRRFLQVAAQLHGQPLNYSRIARDVGVDDSTVSSYYSILEDTLVGFFLPGYAGSERKKLKKTPKFYLFDNGVYRALAGLIDFPAVPGSFEYGTLFEQLVISEIIRRFEYEEISITYSYFATDDGAEIDLLIQIGPWVVALIEIKSATEITLDDLRHLRNISPDFKGSSAYCLYGGTISRLEEGVRIVPWLQGIEELLMEVRRRIADSDQKSGSAIQRAPVSNGREQ